MNELAAPKPRGRVNVSVFNTPAPIFATLAKVFHVTTSPNGHQWITLQGEENVEVTFHEAETTTAVE